MPACDTTWLLALLDPHDARHPEARARAEQGDPVQVPALVLAETLQVVFARRRPVDGTPGAHAATRRTLDALRDLPNLVLDPGTDEATRTFHEHPALSWTDAVVLASAHDGLLTFDARQEALV